MTVLNATEARAKLFCLIDEAALTHQPVVITGKRGNAVLVSEEDWNAISQTLHLFTPVSYTPTSISPIKLLRTFGKVLIESFFN